VNGNLASAFILLLQSAPAPTLDPSVLPRVGTVDERFQSYNVEMVEVTGGRFWRHYGPEFEALLQQPVAPPAGSGTPTGINPALYEQRPPIDLYDQRLRTLAAGLGPAYVRVSGTWANSTWLADADPPPSTPPKGWNAVLTRQQWKGVADFVRAVDGKLVTSFATSAGPGRASPPARSWTTRSRSASRSPPPSS
jgi:heparanase 1